jgi:predicted nucleic acid-binding protein
VDGRIRIIVPDLLSYEVANALRYYPAMTADRLRSALRLFYDVQIALVPASAALLGLAAGYTYRHRLTIYDAVYAVLAETHSCRLVTADARLLDASDRAVPISDWSLGQ